MPIEDANSIDMATRDKDGTVELVMTDSGGIADPEERYRLFRAKLDTYVRYLVSGGFEEDFPETGLDQVKFKVVSPVPPNEKMARIQRVVLGMEDGELSIPVVFEQFP